MKLTEKEQQEVSAILRNTQSVSPIVTSMYDETIECNPELRLLRKKLYKAIAFSKPTYGRHTNHFRNVDMTLDYIFNDMKYYELSKKYKVCRTLVSVTIARTVSDLKKEILEHI
jgi:hypothetical protein